MTSIHIIDAFTRDVDAGNRAGVVLDADCLQDSEMQQIAAFAGYSETAFVLSATHTDHDIHVRYFTPSSEVPICGHATIATHFLRAELFGLEQYPVKAKTGAGILPVSVQQVAGGLFVTMKQGAVEYGTVFNATQRATLAAALGIKITALVERLPVQVVSTGHSKVIVPMNSLAELDALQPCADKLRALSESIDCNGFFPFVLKGRGETPETFGRMFAPAIGIYEDPVTGNANGPLGAYLVQHGLVDLTDTTFKGHQGHALGKPGIVYVTVTLTPTGLDVSIAGQAVRVGILDFKHTNPKAISLVV